MAETQRTTPYAWYVAGVLSLAYVTSIMDRYLLAVVSEDLKRSLYLTDLEIGFLQGPGFITFFVLATIPFGWISDTMSRRTLITCGIAIWSLATAACGLAGNFYELLAARLMVGLGEAALTPAAVSLIIAYFSPEQRGRGLSVFSMGSSFGRAAGFLGGGFLLVFFTSRDPIHLLGVGRIEPWQGVFIVAGIVGIAFAMLVYLSVREPPRTLAASTGSGVKAGISYFWKHKKAYSAVFIPYGMAAAIQQMLGAWTISFYARDHGLAVAAASALVGASGLLFGPMGHLGGGYLVDLFRARGNIGTHPTTLGILLVAATLFVVLFVLSPNVWVAAVCFGILYAMLSASAPTTYAGAQAFTPEGQRGMISSLLLISTTILGAGLGPFLVAVVSDLVLHDEGQLGTAIIITTIFFGLMGAIFAFGARRAFGEAVNAHAP